MSALFDHLSHLYVEGQKREIPDLLSDQRFAQSSRQTEAAVLIAVTDRPVLKQRSDRTDQQGPGVILTQRPQDMRDHPGQVAFPGGKIDAGEDAVTAALREAQEELAMNPDDVRVIGTTDCYQTGTGFNVTPVLAVIPPDLSFKPSPGEVEEWFEAPLAMLLEPSNWDSQEVFWRGQNRRYLEMHYEGFRIWGVTAAIIANLARRIAPEGLRDVA